MAAESVEISDPLLHDPLLQVSLAVLKAFVAESGQSYLLIDYADAPREKLGLFRLGFLKWSDLSPFMETSNKEDQQICYELSRIYWRQGMRENPKQIAVDLLNELDSMVDESDDEACGEDAAVKLDLKDLGLQDLDYYLGGWDNVPYIREEWDQLIEMITVEQGHRSLNYEPMIRWIERQRSMLSKEHTD